MRASLGSIEFIRWFSAKMLRARRDRLLHSLFAIVPAVFGIACVHPTLDPIIPGIRPDLAGSEGLLIVHVDTQIPIESISLGRNTVSRHLASGKHIWLVRIDSGSYRWDRISFGHDAGAAHVYRVDPKDEDFTFTVEAGKTNYPGELVIRADTSSRSIGGSVSIRNRNHSARAVRALREFHPDLGLAYPLRYAGPSGDTFLEYYSLERSSVGKAHPEGSMRRKAP